MFTFTEEELSLSPHMRNVLVPPHMRGVEGIPSGTSEEGTGHVAATGNQSNPSATTAEEATS